MDLNRGVIIVYNGEVYNHQELRILLINKQYRMQGHSDTEVVSLLYNEFGVASFTMLNGMFAFVILDREKKKIYFVRDRLGIKPLYLYKDERGLYASSEIKGLKPFPDVQFEINRQNVFEFFNQGFLYEPDTGFTYIKKLMPGHYLEFDLQSGHQKIERYVDHINTNRLNPIEENIAFAVNEQLVADVPLGVFFSGGVDSSLIAACIPKSDLFFAQFDDAPDTDLIYSDAIAKHFNRPLITANLTNQSDKNNLLKWVDFVAEHSEELLSDYTFYATYHLAKAAQDKGYKVMLSGMGGDELFAGYPRYLILKYHRLIKLFNPVFKAMLFLNIFPKKLDKKFERLVSYSEERHWPTAYARLLGYFNRQDLHAFFSGHGRFRAVLSNEIRFNSG